MMLQKNYVCVKNLALHESKFNSFVPETNNTKFLYFKLDLITLKIFL